ncbi:MAG: hypothetical protein WCB27_18600 [Thermoguttaceae bacterium]
MTRCIFPRLMRSVGCFGIVLLLVVVFQPGCKRSTTVVGPKGEKGTVSRDDEGTEVAFKGMNGEDVRSSTGKAGVALPAGFPADVPVYPQATPMTVATVHKETRVILTTSDPRQKVVTFYNGKMKENGWKSKASTELPQMTMLQGEKSGRTMVVLISETSDGKVQITLSHKG